MVNSWFVFVALREPSSIVWQSALLAPLFKAQEGGGPNSSPCPFLKPPILDTLAANWHVRLEDEVSSSECWGPSNSGKWFFHYRDVRELSVFVKSVSTVILHNEALPIWPIWQAACCLFHVATKCGLLKGSYCYCPLLDVSSYAYTERVLCLLVLLDYMHTFGLLLKICGAYWLRQPECLLHSLNVKHTPFFE